MAGKTFPLAVVISAVDRITGPLFNLNSRIGQLGASLNSLGKNLTTKVSAPLAALGGFAIKTGIDIDRSFNRIRSVTGANAQQMQELQAAVRALPPDLGLTRGIQALEGLAEQGFKANDSLAALLPTARLSKAANIDGAAAAGIVADSLAAVGGAASDAERLLDLMMSATGGSSLMMREFAQVLQQAGPGMKAAGLSLEDMVAAAKGIAAANFEGSLGVTVLRQAVSKLIKPSSEARMALSRLGVDREALFDAENRLRSLDVVLGRLRTAGATTSDMLAIFGQEAGVAVAAIDPNAIAAARAELDQAAGSLQRGVIEASKGAAAAWERFTVSVTVLMDKISQSGLLEVFEKVANLLTEIAAKFAALSPATQKWVVGLGALAAAVGPILLVLGSFIGSVGSLVAGVSAAWPVIVGAFVAIKAAVLGFSAVLAATPIGWLIAGVAALAGALYLLWDNWEWVTDKMSAAWERMMLPVRLGLEYLMAVLPSLRDLVPDWMLDVVGVSKPGASSDGAAASAAAVGAAAQVSGGVVTERAEASVNVRFQNLPAGASVSTERNDGVDLSLQQGFALGT